MSRPLPPVDLHAHISPKASPAELERLGAVVFAATRSIVEFESVKGRRDPVAVWGLGCHPGVKAAQDGFNAARFSALLASTGYVSEIGIDRRSNVPMDMQIRVLNSILDRLGSTPRIAAIHSAGAPGAVLDALDRHRIKGAVLHWWRGDWTQTEMAIQLGCWFSINAAGLKNTAHLAAVPLDRILTETDHPSGDRGSTPPRQPGAVGDVESALAGIHGIAIAAVRRRVWSNLVHLADEVGVADLLPVPVQRMLNVARGEGLL